MKLAEGVLNSGRHVTISHVAEYSEINIYVVEYGTDQILGRSRNIVVKCLGPFGRPLAERIRETVVELDQEIEAAKRGPVGPEQKLMDAAYQALYYGLPRSGRNRSGAPPLVRPPKGAPSE